MGIEARQRGAETPQSMATQARVTTMTRMTNGARREARRQLIARMGARRDEHTEAREEWIRRHATDDDLLAMVDVLTVTGGTPKQVAAAIATNDRFEAWLTQRNAQTS